MTSQRVRPEVAGPMARLRDEAIQPRPAAPDCFGISCLANDAADYDPPNALNVIMVRVSCTPSMVCTFWAMK